jgi:FkbM family methyltransferase
VDHADAHWAKISAAVIRDYVERSIFALPDELRRPVWRLRRRVSRTRRSRRERRGDFSRSHPSQPALRAALARNLTARPGFFVEAGANDGYFESNTYELEREYGWHGVLVEPAPELARAARLARPGSRVVCCALVGPESAGSNTELEYAGAMTRVGAITDHARTLVTDAPPHVFTAPGRTLSSVLDDVGAPAVDFLSLDVEGYEAEVLRGLEDRHAPAIALIEIGEHDERRGDIECVLGPRYELVERPTSRDALYRQREP